MGFIAFLSIVLVMTMGVLTVIVILAIEHAKKEIIETIKELKEEK